MVAPVVVRYRCTQSTTPRSNNTSLVANGKAVSRTEVKLKKKVIWVLLYFYTGV